MVIGTKSTSDSQLPEQSENTATLFRIDELSSKPLLKQKTTDKSSRKQIPKYMILCNLHLQNNNFIIKNSFPLYIYVKNHTQVVPREAWLEGNQ